VGALEGVGDAEEEMLVGDGADELEADGESPASEAAGDGKSGDAGEIGGTIVAEKKRAGGMIGSIEMDFFGADERRGDGSRGDDDGVEGVIR